MHLEASNTKEQGSGRRRSLREEHAVRLKSWSSSIASARIWAWRRSDELRHWRLHHEKGKIAHHCRRYIEHEDERLAGIARRKLFYCV